MFSLRQRADIAALAILATVALALYSYRAATRSETASEKALKAGVDLLVARSGHDEAGRFLPMFVRVSPGVWLPPVSTYTSAIASVLAVAEPARRSSAVFAAFGIVLIYVFGTALFRERLSGWLAALLLLTNPAYVTLARAGTLDGMWVVVPLLISLIAVSRFAENNSLPALAVATGALAASVYTQPSGALLALIVAVAAVTALSRARLLTVRDGWRAVGVGAAVMVPLLIWFAFHPATYTDTLGRWVLHPAYIRNPWSLVIRSMNWFSLSEWSSIYWNFFDPTRLLYNAAAPAYAGTFLMALGVFLIIAVCDIARPRQPRTPRESALVSMVAVAFLGTPIVPAIFAEPGAIQKAISFMIFGTILCTLGVRTWWSRDSWEARAPVVGLLVLALLQFVLFYLSVVSTGGSYAGT